MTGKQFIILHFLFSRHLNKLKVLQVMIVIDKKMDNISGLDTRSEHCQRFFREGLTVSFTKIMTDEAVSGWKYEIHVS